ncbi:sodium:proton antiporter [Kineococcus sp. SYSU DK004]|uniref:sodium:proton antiporter n=1 Tax=Kineococcus sp. SYSU DK004 TaxID=3383125 RepID=UPI003D7DD79C
MSPTVVLTLAVAGLVATGVWLLTSRHATRVVLGFVLAGNGVNLLLVAAAGPAGLAPVVGPDGAVPEDDLAAASDPLPQAFVLTAIVITFAVTAFCLALAYRLSRADGDDVLRDAAPSRRATGVAEDDGGPAASPTGPAGPAGREEAP